ncbi:MAG: methionyl-tRNA formyltransferase [Clostridium sp.]|nr:methionyl-tRNA formyltransferase [Clostridium sp.]
MNIVFMGTPEFSVPSLKELDEKFDIKLVVTQPDRKRGRGKKVIHSAVKKEALKRNIRVITPSKIREDKEAIETIKEINPDFIVVVAYGQILSEEILNIPKYGSINLHASLLPKLRGAAPLNWALIEGHKETGNTTMYMEKGLDTGDMLLRDVLEIDDSMNVESIHDSLSKSGGSLLIETLVKIKEGSIKRKKQDDSKATYAKMIDKDLQEINWNKDSNDIRNLIRGLSPYPGSFSFLGEDRVKILASEIGTDNENNKYEPGEIIKVSKEGILVKTKNGSLLITKVQFPNKKPMMVSDYLNGNEILEKKFEGRG